MEALGSRDELPARFRRQPMSAEEMAMIDVLRAPTSSLCDAFRVQPQRELDSTHHMTTSVCCHHDATPEVEHVPASLDAGCSELPADHLAILCDRWVGRMIRQPRQQKAKAKSRGLLAACCVMQEEHWQLET